MIKVKICDSEGTLTGSCVVSGRVKSNPPALSGHDHFLDLVLIPGDLHGPSVSVICCCLIMSDRTLGPLLVPSSDLV